MREDSISILKVGLVHDISSKHASSGVPASLMSMQRSSQMAS